MAKRYAEDYQPIVYEWFMEGVESVPSMINELFMVQGSTRADERTLGVGGSPVEPWLDYERDGKVSHVDMDLGYAETYTHKEYAIRVSLKTKHIEDDQTGLIQQTFADVGVSAQQRRETDAASVFNSSFATVLGPDGVVLCSASHPVGPDNTGTTRDNLGTEAFSYAALKNARDNMRGWNDGQGNPYMVNGKLALLPIELDLEASEIFGATGKPGTTSNDASALNELGFGYKVWDYLTDAESWWLLDTVRTKRFLRWYDRKLLFPKIIEETTTHVVYEFMMRYSFGWSHWSWLYGNTV